MDKPSYYAVIPADVRYADIPSSAKLLYAEITCLCNANGYCWASNGYFAELYNVAQTTISEWISILVKGGFLLVEIDRIGGNKRKIWLATPIQKNTKTPLRNFPNTSSAFPEDPSSAFPEENNTSINTKINNTYLSAQKEKNEGDTFNENITTLEWSKSAEQQFGDGERAADEYRLFHDYYTIGKGADTRATPDGWFARWRSWCRNVKHVKPSAGKQRRQAWADIVAECVPNQKR